MMMDYIRMLWQDECPDCGVTAGGLHGENCDQARCAVTGGQRFQCSCTAEDSCNTRWEGLFHGWRECIEWGWWAREFRYQLRRCEPMDVHPDARPDSNRILREAHWDTELQRLVKNSA
jgi:hypothetical protein